MSEELIQLSVDNPIRKIVRYRGDMNPMIYMIGKPYGGGKTRMCAIECIRNDKGEKEYYFFVNKLNAETGKFDDLQYLWKTEKAPDITVEYNLDFDEI